MSEVLVPQHLQQLPWLQETQHQGGSLRAHTTCRLGSPTPAILLWLLKVHTSTQVDPRASAALWAPDNSSLLALLAHRNPQLATQCQEPATTHQVKLRLQALQFIGTRRLPFPQSTEVQHSPPIPDSKRALTPLPKSKNARFPTKGRKTITCYSAGSTRSPVPPRYIEA
jgi:hypothetical protein